MTPPPRAGEGAAPADGAASRVPLLATFGCLVLPWLNPFAPGPSAWVAPWLFSFLCAALACAAAARGLPDRGVPLVLAGVAAWSLLRGGWTPEAAALAAGCLLVWMMAAVTAGEDRQEVVQAVAVAWLCAAAVSTAAALLQYFGIADRLEPWVNQSTAGEAYANLRQRNQFASLTVIGMAAVLWLSGHGLARWPGAVAMAWLAAGNAATTSRTGLLQLLLVGALVAWWAGWQSPRARLWLVALAGYAAAAVALPAVAEAITGQPAASLWGRVSAGDPCGSRLVLWSNVLTLVRERPWAGWGWGELDFAHYTTLYAGERFCDILDNAHNLPLHLAVELGLPAALAVCGAAVAAVWQARPWREHDPTRQLAWAILLVIGLHSLLEYPLWYGPFQMAFGLALGMLWPGAVTATPRRPAAWGRGAALLLAAGALAGTGYAAWDYWRASQIYLPPQRRAPEWRDDPLARLGGSWLFRGQVQFAELTLTPVTPANAARLHEMAARVLHYSPEPAVIEKSIDSAVALGREDELPLLLARYRAAFPQAYAEWAARNRRPARR